MFDISSAMPTKSDKRRNSSVAFSYLFDSNQYVLMGRSVLGQMSPHPDIKRQVRLSLAALFQQYNLLIYCELYEIHHSRFLFDNYPNASDGQRVRSLLLR